MVLEGLIKPLTAEKRPFELFFIGLLLSSVAIFLSIFVFSPYASIISITLTTMVCVPIVYGVIKLEEHKSMEITKEALLVKAHGRALLFFMFLFLGFVASFALWYIFLPETHISEVFSVQMATISGAADNITGNAVNPTKAFTVLLGHNMKVLFFCILFAFLYGFGAIFLLTWNASVMGAAIGDSIRSTVSSGFFTSISATLLKYLTHGIPEMIAYFTAGLAGGIISIAIINHDIKSDKFKHIVFDSLDLIVLSIIILTAAAVIEVFITPVLL